MFSYLDDNSMIKKKHSFTWYSKMGVQLQNIG